jgi:hypothetical protein
VETGPFVVYRKRDLRELAAQLQADGHAVEPIDFHTGDSEADRSVDEFPYTGQIHIKLRLGGYASTSFGLIIRKGSRPHAERPVDDRVTAHAGMSA